MHEFESFVYLDVQKTGSSFISTLLREFCTEKEIRKEKHGCLRDGYDPGKLYFISVRDPLDQYISLYSFGCQGDGALFTSLHKHGLGDLYDETWSGFRAWLKFVLHPENAYLFNNEYGTKTLRRKIGRLVGPQSYRVLSLAIPDAQNVLAACNSVDDIRHAYQSKNIARHTIRYENFRADLANLFSTSLRNSFSNLDEVLRHIQAGKPHNASERIDRRRGNLQLGKNQKRRLEEREWLLHEAFGY